MSAERRGPAGAHHDDPREQEDAWNAVASRYMEFWGRRLQPYRDKAVAVFNPSPPGPLAVPGCGPGLEVLRLAEDFPQRSLLATDLASSMIGLLLAELRSRSLGTVVATPGAAESLSSFVRQAAGVLSCFLLDLLPNPIAALADWSRCLRGDGSMTVLFWTRPRTGSPAACLYSVLQARLGFGRLLWEARAVDTLPKLGLKLARDERVQFEVPYDSPDEFFHGMVEAGPLHFLKLRFGGDSLDECRKAWLVNHGLRRRGSAWFDTPEARLWLLERTEAGEESH